MSKLFMSAPLKKALLVLSIAATSLVALEASRTAAACDWDYGCNTHVWVSPGPAYGWGYGYPAYGPYPYYRVYHKRNFYDLRGRCFHYGGYEIYEIPCHPYYPN